jgi:hypothetical protein
MAVNLNWFYWEYIEYMFLMKIHQTSDQESKQDLLLVRCELISGPASACSGCAGHFELDDIYL